MPLVCAIDDDESLRESLDWLLRSAGFDVRTFPTPNDFLQWSANNHPDCIIVDFSMDGMNGLEFLRELRTRGIEAPVIFATGIGYGEVWRQLRSSGALAVFVKPLDADALLEAVQAAVSGTGPP
ncbi:MAG: response regulator [Polyangiaceae bacterium]|jgi:two-component system response regulator FixJ